MATKIKKLELEQAGEHKIVKVTLERGGQEYEFIAKALDVLDEVKFQGLLRLWKEKAIPEREAEKQLTDEGIETKLEKLKNTKVK